MSETQGGKANKSGKILEQQVTNALSLHGFQTIEYKTWVDLSMFDRRVTKADITNTHTPPSMQL